MKLISKDFESNGFLDKKFTCDAEDFSPHMQWENAPNETKSFALSCLNSDTEHGTIAHWYVYNIPADIREIPQAGPVPGIEIENDFSTLGYTGPNAPSRMHAYEFTIYALDTETLEGINPLNFRKEIHKHTIEKAQIVGKYEKEFDFREFKRMSCH